MLSLAWGTDTYYEVHSTERSYSRCIPCTALPWGSDGVADAGCVCPFYRARAWMALFLWIGQCSVLHLCTQRTGTRMGEIRKPRHPTSKILDANLSQTHADLCASPPRYNRFSDDLAAPSTALVFP